MAETRTKAWQSFLAQHPLADRADDTDFWDQFLTDRPEVLHHLLSDLYRATYGAEKPPNLADLWAMLEVPEFTSEPFGIAVQALLRRRDASARWLALQAGVTPQVLGRFLNGQRPVVNIHDTKGAMQRIESVARPLRVHPAYFAEWRRMWVMQVLDSAFEARPELSVEVFRRFSGFERPK